MVLVVCAMTGASADLAFFTMIVIVKMPADLGTSTCGGCHSGRAVWPYAGAACSSLHPAASGTPAGLLQPVSLYAFRPSCQFRQQRRIRLCSVSLQHAAPDPRPADGFAIDHETNDSRALSQALRTLLAPSLR